MLRDFKFTENEYGLYCIPKEAEKGIVAQKALSGEAYEKETIERIRSFSKDKNVLHAGSCFGDFLPGICSVANFVYAFEPYPIMFRCSKITKLLNNINNCSIRNLGLSDSPGTKCFKTKDNAGEFLAGRARIREDGDVFFQEKIRVDAIDNLLPYENKLAVLHLDIEGHEKFALQGALRTIKRNKPVLILEFNASTQYFLDSDWFRDEILSFGYIEAERYFIHKQVFNCVFKFEGS